MRSFEKLVVAYFFGPPCTCASRHVFIVCLAPVIPLLHTSCMLFMRVIIFAGFNFFRHRLMVVFSFCNSFGAFARELLAGTVTTELELGTCSSVRSRCGSHSQVGAVSRCSNDVEADKATNTSIVIVMIIVCNTNLRRD